jgi:hypothetical protein
VVIRLAGYPHQTTLANLAGGLLGFAMIFGWTLLGIRLNRRSEQQMLAALQHVMADEQSARIVGDLLSSR